MTATYGQMKCKLYLSAFSGEMVFQAKIVDGPDYEGVAPNHYILSNTPPTKDGVNGQIKVRVLREIGKEMRVCMPDGECLWVSADNVYKQEGNESVFI